MKTTKLIVKLFIILYASLRLLQAFSHIALYYIAHKKIFSSITALSITVVLCSLVLLIGALGECQVLLEVWMVWTVLQFGAIVFNVFNLDFEDDSFIKGGTFVNITISSSKQVKNTVKPQCKENSPGIKTKYFSTLFSSPNYNPHDGPQTS